MTQSTAPGRFISVAKKTISSPVTIKINYIHVSDPLRRREQVRRLKKSATLKGCDGFVLHHEVWHDLVQRTLPFTGCTRARTNVGSEFTNIFMVNFLGVDEHAQAAITGILAREENGVGHLLHGKVPNIPCNRKIIKFHFHH